MNFMLEKKHKIVQISYISQFLKIMGVQYTIGTKNLLGHVNITTIPISYYI